MTSLSAFLKEEDLRPVVIKLIDEKLEELKKTWPGNPDASVKTLQEALDVKEAAMKELVKALQAQESKVKDQESALETKDLKIKELEESLKAKESNEAKLETSLSTKETKLKELENELKVEKSKVEDFKDSLDFTKVLLGAAKSKFLQMESRHKEETAAILSLLTTVAKEPQESATVKEIEETTIMYVDKMVNHFRGDKLNSSKEVDASYKKLMAEMAMHDKLSAVAISSLELTIPLSQEQKETLKSAMFIVYKNHMKLSDVYANAGVDYRPIMKAAMIHSKIIQSPVESKIPEVTPISLGIIHNSLFYCIIPKDTKIPAKILAKEWLLYGNKTSFQLAVYQGEEINEDVDFDNWNDIEAERTWLGEFYLTDIRPNVNMKGHNVEVDVTMEIDSQGVLEVTAECEMAGKKETFKVPAYQWMVGLSANHKTT